LYWLAKAVSRGHQVRDMHAPTMPHYVDTVFEMLDELDWGLIDWSGEDRLDF